MKRFITIPFFCLLAAGVMIAQFSSSRDHPLPQNLQEAVSIAERMGLHWRGEGKDGTRLNVKIILSKRPLLLRDFYRPVANKDLKGAAVVYRGSLSGCYFVLPDQDEMTPWGNLFLFGDQELIQELLAFN